MASFGRLTALTELCITLDDELGPAVITGHLSKLLPEATVLVQTYWSEEEQKPPVVAPEPMDRVFLPGVAPAWMAHPNCCGPSRKALPLGTLRF